MIRECSQLNAVDLSLILRKTKHDRREPADSFSLAKGFRISIPATLRLLNARIIPAAVYLSNKFPPDSRGTSKTGYKLAHCGRYGGWERRLLENVFCFPTYRLKHLMRCCSSQQLCQHFRRPPGLRAVNKGVCVVGSIPGNFFHIYLFICVGQRKNELQPDCCLFH